jgi:hypothetical protein
VLAADPDHASGEAEVGGQLGAGDALRDARGRASSRVSIVPLRPFFHVRIGIAQADGESTSGAMAMIATTGEAEL